MEIQRNYSVIISTNEKDSILTLLEKFVDKNLPLNQRMDCVMYDIFYVTHNFTHEFAQRYDILPMIYYNLNKHSKVLLTNQEMCNLVWMLGDLVDIIGNSGNSVLPDIGKDGQDDALIHFVQLLHGADEKDITYNVGDILNTNILSDIEYFKSIKSNLDYYYKRLQSLVDLENQSSIHLDLDANNREIAENSQDLMNRLF